MAELQIAQVGCGGMGLRHLYGEVELKRVFDSFDLVAVCDVNLSAAEHVANEAEKGLGRRPRVYTSFDELLDKETSLDAVDIVTDVGLHHVLALKAFEAGLHVAVEKPLGLTVRACKRIIEAAGRAGKVLLVEENHRRDPVNRLVKAIIDGGVLGRPRLIYTASTSGSRTLPHTTAWRHIKLRGGYLLDYGVHDTDLFGFFMGEVDSVYAETRLWETSRYTTERTQLGPMAKFYAHRVKEDIERARTVETTSEDMALGLIRFKSGAIGHYTKTIAAPGQSTAADIIYCDEGSLKLPGSRSGRPTQVTMMGAERPLAARDVLGLVPGFELDDITAAFFRGRRRLSSYNMPYEKTDRKFIAMGLQDLAQAIAKGREPQVTGEAGLKAVALVYAMLESGHRKQAVSFDDIVEDRVNAYQQEVNHHAGL